MSLPFNFSGSKNERRRPATRRTANRSSGSLCARRLFSVYRLRITLSGGMAFLFLNSPHAWAQTGPVITTQPASQTAVLRSHVRFTVEASGPRPFAYQWRFNSTNLGNGTLDTVAGGGDGGLASNTSLYRPFGVAFDSQGNLFIADAGIGIIRKITTNGLLTRVAGGGPNYPGDAGSAILASLIGPNP